jgi:tellurite resistance protein
MIATDGMITATEKQAMEDILREEENVREVSANLEQEIRDMFGKRHATDPRLPPATILPAYVNHAPDVDEVGRVSSEVLVQSYEASAKSFEQMAQRLKDEMKECEMETLQIVQYLEGVRKDTEAAIDSCNDAAAEYRKEAKVLFARIQERARLAAMVRSNCTDMIKQIDGKGE